MEKYRKARTPLRALFTKSVNALEGIINGERKESFREELQASMDCIERKSEQINELDKLIINGMIEDPTKTT